MGDVTRILTAIEQGEAHAAEEAGAAIRRLCKCSAHTADAVTSCVSAG